MPVSRELSITYGSTTVGGSSARQITGFIIHSEEYDSGYVEFEFVTSSSTEAAFGTEVIAMRDAFRQPRQNLTVTQGSTTLLSRSHSVNTGLDTTPRIIKDGDPADTGRSRHFRVRIDYGLPADNVSASFRRGSTINIEYSPSRRRTVTISGVYTANSTDGTTGSRAQYQAQITTYAASVCNAIDSTTSLWELVSEPQISIFETDKVCNFTIVYRENLFNQAIGTLDDTAIVDPVLVITRERTAPGDSTSGGPGIGGGGFGGLGGAGAGLSRPTVFTTGPGVGNTVSTGTVARPTILNLTYNCGIDKTVRTLVDKWTNTIRPFLIQTVRTIAGAPVVLLEEKPAFDEYENRISATMQFISYSATILKQKITVKESVNYNKILHPVMSRDPYEYYEYPGPVARLRSFNEEREEVTSQSDPQAILNGLYAAPGSQVSNLPEPENWTLISRSPELPVLRQGLQGADVVNIAEIRIETVCQYRKKVKASVANAGGVTGAGITL